MVPIEAWAVFLLTFSLERARGGGRTCDEWSGHRQRVDADAAGSRFQRHRARKGGLHHLVQLVQFDEVRDV